MKLPGFTRRGLDDAQSRGKAEEKDVGYDTFLWSSAVLQAYISAFALGMILGSFLFGLVTGVFTGMAAVALTALTPLVRVIATPFYRFHKGRRDG